MAGSLIHHSRIVKGNIFQLPAGGAPGGIKIDDDRFLLMLGLFEEADPNRAARPLPGPRKTQEPMSKVAIMIPANPAPVLSQLKDLKAGLGFVQPTKV